MKRKLARSKFCAMAYGLKWVHGQYMARGGPWPMTCAMSTMTGDGWDTSDCNKHRVVWRSIACLHTREIGQYHKLIITFVMVLSYPQVLPMVTSWLMTTIMKTRPRHGGLHVSEPRTFSHNYHKSMLPRVLFSGSKYRSIVCCAYPRALQQPLLVWSVLCNSFGMQERQEEQRMPMSLMQSWLSSSYAH